MIEVGVPFSDPLADGPVIQSAATRALHNGMTLSLLLSQLRDIKGQVSLPLILMGYLNVFMHYGMERFFASCVEAGVSGVIIPDLPFKDYMQTVKPLADRFDLRVIMMITPETSDERIRFIDNNTDGFIYMVSSGYHRGSKQLRRCQAGLLQAHQCHEPAQPTHDRIRHKQPADTAKRATKRLRCHHRVEVCDALARHGRR